MARLFSALCAMALFFAAVPPLAAQEKICPIEVYDDGMLFSVVVNLNDGRKDAVELEFHGGPKSKKVVMVAPGTHTIETRHTRTGFPQLSRYELWEGGKKIWSTVRTVDPKQFTIKEGQRLQVLVYLPIQPYDGKFFTVRGVNCALILPQPYWFNNLEPGKFKGKEDFPNSIFFHVDKEKWGTEKVLGALADYFVGEIHNPASTRREDYRIQSQSFVIGLTTEGKIPSQFKEAPKDELRKEMKAALIKAFDAMKKENCYRTFSPADVKYLKAKGYVPADTPDGRLHVPFSRGLELAVPLLKKWRELEGK